MNDHQNTTDLKGQSTPPSSEPASFNLLDYAPENFKNHLQYLRDVVTYDNGREQQGLSTISDILRGHHYIITGNEGVGKEEAAHAIFEELRDLGIVSHFVKKEAIRLFDPNDGYGNNIDQLINDNIYTFQSLLILLVMFLIHNHHIPLIFLIEPIHLE